MDTPFAVKKDKSVNDNQRAVCGRKVNNFESGKKEKIYQRHYINTVHSQYNNM